MIYAINTVKQKNRQDNMPKKNTRNPKYGISADGGFGPMIYTRIRKLTPYEIDLGFKFSNRPGWSGGWYSGTSISSLDYRKNDSIVTQAKINIDFNFKKNFAFIKFFSDWGRRSKELKIPFYFKKDLINFINECIKEELLEEDFKNTIKRIAFCNYKKRR